MGSVSRKAERPNPSTHIFLLLMNMANLEPDIFLGEWPRRVGDDILETLPNDQQSAINVRQPTNLQALVVFLLLLVDNPKSEVDLIRLFKIRLHAHDLRECFFGVFERAVAIVQYANSIP